MKEPLCTCSARIVYCYLRTTFMYESFVCFGEWWVRPSAPKNMNEALPAFFHTFSWENFFFTVPLIRVPVRRLGRMYVKCGDALA